MRHNKVISNNTNLITNNDRKTDLILASLYHIIDKKKAERHKLDAYIWSVYKDAKLNLVLHIEIQ